METGVLPIMEKANYVGNKRRLAKYIVDKFPDGTKSIADVMCGVGAVLIEAARRGYRVRGNDLSIVPYYYTKGVFEGAALSEEDVGRLKAAPPHDGWLTREWKGIYPRSMAIRRYLDGLVRKAKAMPGSKALAAKAVMSAVLQTMYADSGSGYSTLRYEKPSDIQRLIDRSAREVNGLIGEVGGKGTVTNENALTIRVPQADVIYFDPPFFKRDKGLVLYFNTYRIMNSILLQKEWKEPNLKAEDVPPLLERLCKSCRHIFISTSSNEQVPYWKELQRHKRMVKRYRVAYSQTSGFGSRDTNQREHLYVAKAAGDDPYLHLPDEDQTLRYVVQTHFRGRSVHNDFRLEQSPGGDLLGWTLNTQIPGSVKEPVQTLPQAKGLDAGDYSKIDWESGEFAKQKRRGGEVNAPILCEKKSLSPNAWLEVEGVATPGEAGSTENLPGVFQIVDKGTVEVLAQRPDLHEYRPHSERRKGGFSYRILFRLMPAAEAKSDGIGAEFEKGENPAWLLIKPDDPTPYVLSERAVEEGWLPPKGFSALPHEMREEVPEEYRYWTRDEEADRKKARDALVEAIGSDQVDLPGLEKAAEEFEKGRRIPFNQWGGSSKYAGRLVEKLPEHKRYVEPFCGSAAVFFAKEAVEHEVLADADTEVVFALKYIQGLTPQGMEALKKFPWTVSRSGFERARNCKPGSDAERFWKMVFTRACAWGGKPNATGYSTISEGKTYDLESLWRFKERLGKARIKVQDWKKTLRENDGADTLFFVDPPYVEEWGGGEGVPPEEIAEEVSALKGLYIVAYTDSARARRALGKAGKLFKMRFLEARHGGLWAKRNRLFVASFDMKKSLDPEGEWLEAVGE